MTHDLIDDRLIGALHVRALTRAGLRHDPVAEHAAVQVSTVQALLEGRLAGEVTIGEVLAHGDLGVGTIAGLDGELVIVDGVARVVDAHGVVREVDGSTRTPFVVVTRFVPDVEQDVSGPLGWAGLTTLLDSLVPAGSPVAAVRVVGEFSRLRLRSVPKQSPPYPSLSEVTAHQVEWDAAGSSGALVGFRFPATAAGVEVPGYHVHFLSDDLSAGGHVLDLELVRGRAAVQECDELTVELPIGVSIGVPQAATTDAIAAAEGRH